jgi:flagellar biosynthetic protein FliR
MTFWGYDVWAAALMFARLGSLVMLLPGFGEQYVPARIRLSLALVLSVAMAPMILPDLPPAPASFAAGAGLVVTEVLIGLMLGIVARILVSALGVAGQAAGLETGLSFAQTADPTMTGGGQVLGVFLTLVGATLVFATDLHHEFLRAIAGSYGPFPAGAAPDLGDAAQLGIGAVGDAFRIGVQIAAPLIVAGLAFRVGLGVLSRLVPQIQVFFVAMPLNVAGGLLIFAFVLSAGMLVWLDRMAIYAESLR